MTIDGIKLDDSSKDNLCALSFTGSGNTLTFSSTNELTSGKDEPGIRVESGTEVVINGYDDSSSLTANGGCYGAGIGGRCYKSGGMIKIEGGNIIATGGDFAAGIGGGSDDMLGKQMASCGLITISSGNVTANGGDYGPGIGVGYRGTGGLINISGGNVTANGGTYSAGIGGGWHGACSSITISSGEVFAKHGESCNYDIGDGNNPTSSGTVGISGDAIIFLNNDVCLTPTTSTHYHCTYVTADADGKVYGYTLPSGWTGAGAYAVAYQLIYDDNGGIGGENIFVPKGCTAHTNDASRITNAGYSFSKWNTQADGQGTSYSVGDDITMTSDLTLYAIWVSDESTMVGSVTPSGEDDPLSGDIVIRFIETMDESNTGTVSLNEVELTGGVWSNASRTYTIAYSGLAYDASNTIEITGFKDTYGTTMTDASYTFTTLALPEINIETQPTDVYVLKGETASLSVVGVSNRTLTYQWYSNTLDSNIGGAEVTGATESTYEPSTDSFGTMYYYCVVKTSVNTYESSISATSDSAEVKVGIKVNGLDISRSDDIVTLSVSAEGDGILSYQWYKNTVDSNNEGEIISEATESTYSLPTDNSGNTYYYYCIVTVNDGSTSLSEISDTITVSTVKDTSADLKSLTVSEGTLDFDADIVTYSVDASGISSIGITAVTENANATMTINEETATSGEETIVSLTNGTNLIPVVVTAEDEDGNSYQKSYIIAVNGTVSDADLSELSVNGYTLNFSSDTTEYSLVVGNSISSIELSAVSSDSIALIVLDGEIIESGSKKEITLDEGENIIETMVVAQDASTKTYTLAISRNGTLNITTESLPIGINGTEYSTTLEAIGGNGEYTWSATGLPDGFKCSKNGIISGTTTSEGEYSVILTLMDANSNKATKTLTLTIKIGCGNGAYVIELHDNSAYTGSYSDDGNLNLTVNKGVSGFIYFGVDISVVKGHTGDDVCLFVQKRNGEQIAYGFIDSDFDNESTAETAFNVKEKDVIEVYIVDGLSNDTNLSTNIL